MDRAYYTYNDGKAPNDAAADIAASENTQTPDVSVILPIFNTERYLDQALDSVSEQSLRSIEIICVNDGSTDGSLEIMQVHGAQDSRIRIIDKQNEGYGASCNRGISEARGRYIAILEPDDWIESNMLVDMIALADSFDQDIDIVKTPYWRIWMPDTPEQRKVNCSYRSRIKPAMQPFTIHDPGVTHLLPAHPRRRLGRQPLPIRNAAASKNDRVPRSALLLLSRGNTREIRGVRNQEHPCPI